MGRKARFTPTLFVALAVMALPLAAEAQLAKRGTYASHFPWQIAPKSMPLGADHTLLVYEVTGTHLNDAGTGFLHGAAVVCYGMNDIRKGVANNRGHCTATDRDGDKAFAGSECRSSQPGGRCEGELQWVGGTGKYSRITGKSTWYPVGAPGGTHGYSVWKGEWQRPD
jgi:hypothetical protein